MSEWISVEDRLPEYGIPVLAYDTEWPDQIYSLMLGDSEDGWLWSGLDSFSSVLSDPDNYVCDDEYVCTHWMLMPEGPKV